MNYLLSSDQHTHCSLCHTLVAYLVPETVEQLSTINDHPKLASLHVPRGVYTSARISKARPKDSTSTLLGGNGISISNNRTVDSEARHLLCLLQQSTNKTFLQPFTVPNRPLDSSQVLAPLVYLNSCAPPRRHVMDEMALNSFLGFP